MWNDWAMEKTDDEIKIMHQHAETTRLLTIYYSGKKNTRRFIYKRKTHAFLIVRFRLYFCYEIIVQPPLSASDITLLKTLYKTFCTILYVSHIYIILSDQTLFISYKS